MLWRSGLPANKCSSWSHTSPLRRFTVTAILSIEVAWTLLSKLVKNELLCFKCEWTKCDMTIQNVCESWHNASFLSKVEHELFTMLRPHTSGSLHGWFDNLPCHSKGSLFSKVQLLRNKQNLFCWCWLLVGVLWTKLLLHWSLKYGVKFSVCGHKFHNFVAHCGSEMIYSFFTNNCAVAQIRRFVENKQHFPPLGFAGLEVIRVDVVK